MHDEHSPCVSPDFNSGDTIQRHLLIETPIVIPIPIPIGIGIGIGIGIEIEIEFRGTRY